MAVSYYRVHGLATARPVDQSGKKDRDEYEVLLMSIEDERRRGDMRLPRLELTFYEEDYLEIHVSFRVTYKDRNADIDEYAEELLGDIESVLGVIITDFTIEEVIPETPGNQW